MNAKLNQQLLEEDRNALAEYRKWFETVELGSLPSAVVNVLIRGELNLKENINFYEKFIDESVQEEYLHFVDEEFLTYEIEELIK